MYNMENSDMKFTIWHITLQADFGKLVKHIWQMRVRITFDRYDQIQSNPAGNEHLPLYKQQKQQEISRSPYYVCSYISVWLYRNLSP